MSLPVRSARPKFGGAGKSSRFPRRRCFGCPLRDARRRLRRRQPRCGDVSTSVSGDRSLNTLSSSGIATLCADVTNYLSNSGLKQDSCHLAGVLDGILPGQLDVDRYGRRVGDGLHANLDQLPDDHDRTVPFPLRPTARQPSRSSPPAPMTAPAQTHVLASQVPACSGINRAAIDANAGVATAAAGQPASSELPGEVLGEQQ